MSQQYANSQPAGFKNHIEKVAIVGAGGHLGKYIATSLLETGKHSVTAITRPDSTNTPPAGVSIAKVNYDDPSSLVAALKGHDALIITMSVMAPPTSQYRLIDAAATAGVPWVIPNEYGSDPTRTSMRSDLQIAVNGQKVRDYIDTKPGLQRLGLACGFWYEHSLCTFKQAFGFDVQKHEATFYDDGLTKINISTWPLCGLAVAKFLSLPVLPDDAADTRPTLAQFRGSYLYFSSFYLCQKDMFASLLRVTGTQEADWTVDYEDSKQRFEDGKREFAAGDRMGFGKMLYARVMYPDGTGAYQEKLHNDLLGLPEEDLDEYTQKAIELAQSGYLTGRPWGKK